MPQSAQSALRSARPHSQPNDQWLCLLLFGFLIFAPLPLASNRYWAIGLLCIWMLGMLVGTALVWARHTQTLRQHLATYRTPLLALAAFAGWVMLQATPLPPTIIETLSPKAFAIYTQTLGQSESWRTLSLDPFQTRWMAILSSVYFSACLLTFILIRTGKRLEWLAMALITSGVLQAIIGIALYSTHAQYQLFFEHFNQDRVRGTFVYHNSMAGYMELCLSVGIGLMLSRLGEGAKAHSQHWKNKLSYLFNFILSPKLALRLMLVIMVIALVLTRSRMGNGAFFTAITVIGLISLILSKRMVKSTIWLIASLIVVDIVIIGNWIGLEKVVQRLQETAVLTEDKKQEETLEQRSIPAKSTFAMISDFPLTGTGAGSFYSSFTAYRPPEVYGFYQHTHNDFIEITSDTGIIGLGLLGGFVVLTTLKGIHILRRRNYPLARGTAFGGLLAITCITIHSTVDFNLQIPCNALTLVVIMSTIWVAGNVNPPKKSSNSD